MKKSELTLMVRKIVREEVAMAIHEVITELKQPVQPKQQTFKPKKNIVEKKSFTTNSVLNDVLNETANDEEWRDMNDGTYSTQDMNSIAYRNHSMETSTNDVMEQTAMEMNVDPSAVSDMMNKDYRSILKKSYAKSGKTS